MVPYYDRIVYKYVLQEGYCITPVLVTAPAPCCYTQRLNSALPFSETVTF